VTLHIFAGGIATETNVFSPISTEAADFEVAGPGEAAETRARILGGSTMSRYSGIAAAQGHAFTQGSYAFAMPGGITTRAAYEELRDMLLAELEAALPVDAVLLTLHGAMVADGYEDCESDIVARMRRVAGDGATIGVLLDPHCDLPVSLVEASDVLVTYREYPHIDIDVRAGELATLVLDTAAGQIDPTTAVFDCRMLGLYPTSREPMRGFVDRMTEACRRPGVLSVSLGHGFPWGDAPAMSTRMLVVADGDAVLAQDVAEELGRDFFSLRREVTLTPLDLDAALDDALSATHGPIVLADLADNAGGGAPSDSTFVLRELLDRGASDAAIALLWDPAVVQQAFAAGEGATIKASIGGKNGPSSGDPLELTVEVRRLVPELVQKWPQTDHHLEVSCGPAACLRCGGIDIVVSTLRQQVLGIEVFTAFDIDPATRRILVVKSTNHFYAAFAPIARDVLYANAPGALTLDLTRIPYRRLDTRRFPWVDDPW
jgi:microcystin degradation protein MlrC